MSSWPLYRDSSLEGGQQRHVQRDVFRLTERLQLIDQCVAAARNRCSRAVISRQWRTGAIGRQFQRAQTIQLLAPVLQQACRVARPAVRPVATLHNRHTARAVPAGPDPHRGNRRRTAAAVHATARCSDQPSAAMWCIVSSNTCSSSASRSSAARSIRSPVRSNGRSASSRQRCTISASCCCGDQRTEILSGSSKRSIVPITCTGCPSIIAKVVRSGSCRRTTASSARRNASVSSVPRSRQAYGMLYGRQLPLHLLQKPQPLLGKRQRQFATVHPTTN